nr:DUF2523 domain-containing protein [uncultured Roseateles sp.]
MNGLGTWLVALAGPLARRVLASLGLGVVTYVGMDAAIGAILNQARAGWGGMPADVVSYVAMSGANVALSLIAGAIIGRVASIALKRMMLL